MTLQQKAQRVKSQLKKVKKEKQLHQTVVAKLAGINKMTIQRYLTLGTMKLDNLQAVCDVIGLEIIIREKISI